MIEKFLVKIFGEYFTIVLGILFAIFMTVFFIFILGQYSRYERWPWDNKRRVCYEINPN